MLSPTRCAVTSAYRVEVSGWDTAAVFFVEKASLEWSEEFGKRIFLTHALPARAMIFIRLLQVTLSAPSCPVAYETQFVSTTHERRHEFRLRRLVDPLIEDAGMTAGIGLCVRARSGG
jgi:hypothetical protein